MIGETRPVKEANKMNNVNGMDYDCIFYFDESGHKGYLKSEPEQNDICLIAGFGFLPNDEKWIESHLARIFEKLDFTGVNKKHASEIFKDGRNAEIRNEFFGYMLGSPIFISYEAISNYGYYQSRTFVKGLADKGMASRTNKSIIIHDEKDENVLIEAMTGLLIKLDALYDIYGYKRMRLVYDRTDKKTEKEILSLIEYLSQKEHVKKVKGFDLNAQKPVFGEIKSVVTNFNIESRIKFDYIIEDQVSDLGLAADIISNAMHHHLRTKSEQDSVSGLNSETIMRDFTLYDKIILLSDDSATDKLFPRKRI